MDAIKAQIAEENCNFTAQDAIKWRNLYEPHYAPPTPSTTLLKNIHYGPLHRNLLDIYIPNPSLSLSPSPPSPAILLYLHGGAFSSGSKNWTDKTYANIGNHFSSTHNLIVVIADHHLLPDATYPDGADDVFFLRLWIWENVGKKEFGEGDVGRVFLCGHSSGGAHVGMDLFIRGDRGRWEERREVLKSMGREEEGEIWPPVRGVLFLNVPWWMDKNEGPRGRQLEGYWGSKEEEVWFPESTLGLFERVPQGSPVLDSRKLPIYVSVSEYEMPPTTEGHVMFMKAYKNRSKPAGTLPLFHVQRGHNHITNIFSIGTEDTTQADEIVAFIRGCCKDTKASL